LKAKAKAVFNTLIGYLEQWYVVMLFTDLSKITLKVSVEGKVKYADGKDIVGLAVDLNVNFS